MIARRNNIKDHNALKKARELKMWLEEEQAKQGFTNRSNIGIEKSQGSGDISLMNDMQGKHESSQEILDSSEKCPMHDSWTPSNEPQLARGRNSDEVIASEMDVAAVEATRSYKTWNDLPNGSEFVYNFTYVKGGKGQ